MSTDSWTRAWNHHGSDMSISPRAIHVLKSANSPNIFWGSVCRMYERTRAESFNRSILSFCVSNKKLGASTSSL